MLAPGLVAHSAIRRRDSRVHPAARAEFAGGISDVVAAEAQGDGVAAGGVGEGEGEAGHQAFVVRMSILTAAYSAESPLDPRAVVSAGYQAPLISPRCPAETLLWVRPLPCSGQGRGTSAPHGASRNLWSDHPIHALPGRLGISYFATISSFDMGRRQVMRPGHDGGVLVF